MTSTAAAITTGSKIFGLLGIVCATINVVAGFGLTNRMLKMFKSDSTKSHTESSPNSNAKNR